MKIKIMAAVCCAVLVFMLTGCQLALENTGSIAGEERMIGAFITTEHLDLFDFEGYLNDNLNRLSSGEIKMSGDTEKYQGRLYATLISKTLTNEETGEPIETQEYVFEDMEGIAYFAARMPSTAPAMEDSYIAMSSDEAISDGHTGIAYQDESTTTTLEGTIYVTRSDQIRAFYLNPVYQSADGSVYLTAGTGITAQMDYEGSKMSQSMDSTVTVTENGTATTESLSITVSVSAMSAPENIVILQMDSDSQLLSRTEYAPDEMPEAFSPGANTEYMIVETHKRGGEGPPTREVYSKDAATIEYFIAREDGICVKYTARLDW